MIHVALAGKLEHAFELLPIGHIESGVVEIRMPGVFRMRRWPCGDEAGPVLVDHDRLAEHGDCLAAGDRHAHAVDLEPVKTVDGVLNHAIIAPAHQPVRSGAVEEEVLPGALPDEVPGILRVDAEQPAAVRFCSRECAARRFLKASLLVGERVLVVACDRRHEADPEGGAVGGITEAFDVPVVSAIGCFECAGESCVFEWVTRVGRAYGGRDLDEVVAVDLGRRGRERNAARGRERRDRKP